MVPKCQTSGLPRNTSLREFDKHEPLAFEPGVYKVRYLREYTPEGFRKHED